MDHGLLQSALIFLLSAITIVPIFQKLGLGSVIGYLVAGIIVGPACLGFFQNVEEIFHFSELGVVLLLFIIGLELEPKKFWKLRKSIFGMGALQMILITSITGLTCIALGLNSVVGVVAGLAFTMSSTAIAMQILRENNFLPTTAGQSAFSILLFQDLSVIPILAILPLLGDSTTSGDLSYMKIAKMLGSVGLVFLVGKFFLRTILRKIAELHSREMFTALALLLVLGVSYLMSQVGLSMGLGAFLAGVLLANSEYRHALETDIEPFKGLLLGLFFISVGMGLDLGIVFHEPLLTFGILFGVLFLKIASHLAITNVFKTPSPQRIPFSIVLSQVGEFSFVIFALAKSIGLLTTFQSSLFNAVAACSMLTTSLLWWINEKLIAPRFENTESKKYDTVLNDNPEVIIAGFGRVGQIVGRLLYTQRIKATVLDHEPDQIELLRKFGFKVYYGDATRVDLLEAAGAGEAKIIVVAIDDVDEAIKLVDLVKEHFPHLKIISRARNVSHVYQLLDRDIAIFERESLDSSLRLGIRVLQQLGWAAHPAFRAAQRFRAHDVALLYELHKNRGDMESLTAKAKEARKQLEDIFEREEQSLNARDSGW